MNVFSILIVMYPIVHVATLQNDKLPVLKKKISWISLILKGKIAQPGNGGAGVPPYSGKSRNLDNLLSAVQTHLLGLQIWNYAHIQSQKRLHSSVMKAFMMIWNLMSLPCHQGHFISQPLNKDFGQELPPTATYIVLLGLTAGVQISPW